MQKQSNANIRPCSFCEWHELFPFHSYLSFFVLIVYIFLSSLTDFFSRVAHGLILSFAYRFVDLSFAYRRVLSMVDPLAFLVFVIRHMSLSFLWFVISCNPLRIETEEEEWG